MSHLKGDEGPLTSAQLAARVGAQPDDVRAVREAAEAAGLTVVAEHASSRRVRVEGPDEVVRAWIDKVPEAVADKVRAVLGSGETQAYPRLSVASAHVASVSYTPVQLAKVYGMPQADGTGQTVAIIELGGGFAQSDLDSYFKGLGIDSPQVQAVGVDGAKNAPVGDPQSADGEVLLDIEVAGAIAPKASFLVYFAPNTDDGFLDAVCEAAHADPAPAAISISWGQSEDQWSDQARSAMDDAFADAAAMGITVTAAAGDNGSKDRDTSAGQHTDFPASSPYVLGCGGTTLRVGDGAVTSEIVWNDGGQGGATGGGVSDTFPLPDWQQHAGVPQREGGGAGRGVPDVAAVADPDTGYQVLVDGQRMVFGGTSAVAPLWAALVARVVQLSGARVGLAQTALYAGVVADKSADHLRDITDGGNGAYDAGPGWDPCTGLGVPDTATMAAFTGTGEGGGGGTPTGDTFEYAVLTVDHGQSSCSGAAVTAVWRQGGGATAAGAPDDTTDPVALLDAYGAKGWELVGPPQIDAAGSGEDAGTMSFWMRRHTS